MGSLYGAGTNGQQFGVRKDWPQLATILDKALAAMTSADKQRLSERWRLPTLSTLSSPINPADRREQISLTAEEQAWLAEHPIVDIYTTKHSAPYQFEAEDGSLVGILADVLDSFEQRLGIRFRRQLLPQGEVVKRVQTGQLPVIGFWPQSGVDPNGPYLSTEAGVVGHLSLYAKTGEGPVPDLGQLRDKTIAVTIGISPNIRDSLALQNKVILLGDPAALIGAVVSGRADYLMAINGPVEFNLRKSQNRDIRAVYTVPEPEIGVLLIHRNEPLLASILNKAIEDIETNELPDILNQTYLISGMAESQRSSQRIAAD